jgi:regulatory protein
MSEATLEAAALFYLGRYASSSGNLRRVLTAKVRRSAAHYGDDPAPLLAKIEALVAAHAGSGAIDDRLYAQSQIGKLRRRGGSGRAITARLTAKGVPATIIAESAQALGDQQGDRDAAIRFARRRRLGPFRAESRAENRQKDLATLGRAGFDYATSVSVIDGEE